MSLKARTLDEVWSERDLCAKLGIPINEKTGVSVKIGYWVKEGLPFIKKSGRRFFYEEDILEFLNKFYTTKNGKVEP